MRRSFKRVRLLLLSVDSGYLRETDFVMSAARIPGTTVLSVVLTAHMMDLARRRGENQDVDVLPGYSPRI